MQRSQFQTVVALGCISSMSTAVLLTSLTPASSAAMATSSTVAPLSQGATNFTTPTSPCYRPKKQGVVTNFFGVPPRWRHCPWLTYPANHTGFCTQHADLACPTMRDVHWSRWRHRAAVGRGWFLPADKPQSKFWARVTFTSPKLLYTRHSRTWGFTKTRVTRLGPLRSRSLLDRDVTYALHSGAAESQCAIIIRRNAFDLVTWVVVDGNGSRGGFAPSYTTWRGRLLSSQWHTGRLHGFNVRGPRRAIRATATPTTITVATRTGERSEAMRQVTFHRWQQVCPLD